MEVKLILGANRKPSIGTTMHDLECIKSIASASRAISAVAKLLVLCCYVCVDRALNPLCLSKVKSYGFPSFVQSELKPKPEVSPNTQVFVRRKSKLTLQILIISLQERTCRKIAAYFCSVLRQSSHDTTGLHPCSILSHIPDELPYSFLQNNTASQKTTLV